jgi:hypothetical protein
MSKKSSARKPSRNSRLFSIFGIVVVLSFVISLFAPDYRSENPTVPPTAIIITVPSPTPTLLPTTEAAPALPTPGQAVAPTP